MEGRKEPEKGVSGREEKADLPQQEKGRALHHRQKERRSIRLIKKRATREKDKGRGKRQKGSRGEKKSLSVRNAATITPQVRIKKHGGYLI